jgi:phosphoheptose isomerase
MSGVLARNAGELRSLLTRSEMLEAQVVAASDALADALTSGKKLLACGNGGSAADASHLTTEFVCRFNRDRRPYPAISLATHGGDLTAIANDYEFNDVFARQVLAFGAPGDVLVVFTTSGRSENVRRALIAANAKQLRTVALLGGEGGVCKGLADVELLVEGAVTARTQEVHKFLLHTICELTERRL